MPKPIKRAYNSKMRQISAQNTKKRIITCAQDLFGSKGFKKVTIEEIAQCAETSAATIYAFFQSKIGILRALMDSALSQEEFELLIMRGATEPSPIKRLVITAKVSRQLYDAETKQLVFFQSAAILDPEFKKLEVEREKRRYERQGKFVTMMSKENVLKEGLALPKARDILWTFTGRDFYRMLVIERGWSSDEYETWLIQLLTQTLLK